LFELATFTEAHVAVQVTVLSHDDVVAPASPVHVIVSLSVKPASHATATDPEVLREPVPPLLFELATVTESHVAGVHQPNSPSTAVTAV
jgi:hypothetical protein